MNTLEMNENIIVLEPREVCKNYQCVMKKDCYGLDLARNTEFRCDLEELKKYLSAANLVIK